MKKYHVYGMGNALVDMEFEVVESFLQEMNIEKGLMTLVEENRQKEIVQNMHGIEHKRNSGGSAANTIIAVNQLGGQCFYSCKVAQDEVGDFFMKDLAELGVKTNLNNHREDGTTGRCLVFVTPDADRTMNTYLGISATFSETELVPEALQDSEYLYVEGYLLASDKAKQAALKARDIAREAGVKTSLTFSDPGIVTHFRDQFVELIGDGFDLIFCNEAEALSFTKKENFEDAVRELKNYTKAFAVTRGAKGAFVYDGEKEVHILTRKVEAIDTNGAGDIFAGSFLYGLTHGYSYGDAGRLACSAASTLVTRFGARLNQQQMHSVFKETLG